MRDGNARSTRDKNGGEGVGDVSTVTADRGESAGACGLVIL